MWDILRTSYDREAERYDGRFASLQFIKYKTMLGERGEGLPPGRPLLDLGCGTGLLCDFLKEGGADYNGLVGVDLSPKMVEAALSKGMEAQTAHMGSLPFEDNHFAAILSFTVLRIIPDEEMVILREAARVLKPGGLFILTILAKNDSVDFRDNLAEAGFIIEETRPDCGQDIGYICRLARP